MTRAEFIERLDSIIDTCEEIKAVIEGLDVDLHEMRLDTRAVVMDEDADDMLSDLNTIILTNEGDD